MSKFRAKLCKFEYAGSNSSIFVGGMRPFMYMGEGGGNRQILDVVRVVCSGLCMVVESVKVLKLSLI